MVGELDESLINKIRPAAVPVTCGAKVTVKGTLCPAVSVTGNLKPLSEYPCPLQLAEDMATADVPAVSVPVRVLLLPIATLPKSIVERETDS